MQIHELTSRRRPTNEASLAGFAGGAKDVLGGIAKQVGQDLVQKQTGMSLNQPLAKSQRGVAGLQMNAQLLQQMAKKGQEAWVIAQQELAKKNNPPVASAAELPVEELKTALENLIDQLVGDNGYTKDITSKDPDMATGIDVAKDTIETSVGKILSLTKSDPDQAKRPLEAAWLEMVTKGIGPLQVYVQQATGASKPGAAPAQQIHPDAEKLMAALGPDNIQKVSTVVQGKTMNKTGSPAVDELLQQAGATLT
jgi:hypothetical protein